MIKTNIKNLNPYIYLYSDVFNTGTVEETKRIMPDDYAETVDSIVNGTSGLNFTERERDYIMHHYLLKKTNSRYAFENNIGTPAVYETRKRLMRKLSKDSYKDYISLGKRKYENKPDSDINIMDYGILPNGIRNALLRAGIRTTEELLGKTYLELRKIRNLGPKKIEKLIDICQSYNMTLHS